MRDNGILSILTAPAQPGQPGQPEQSPSSNYLYVLLVECRHLELHEYIVALLDGGGTSPQHGEYRSVREYGIPFGILLEPFRPPITKRLSPPGLDPSSLTTPKSIFDLQGKVSRKQSLLLGF